MDKIALIKTEIERRIRELDEQIVDIYDSKAVLRKNELQRLLSFLDTLSEKEPEADLEKEIEWEWVHREKQEVDLIECAEMDREEFARFARHFAEWGAEHTPLPEDTVIFQKGVEEGKRLMMEEWLKDRDGCFWDGVNEGKKAMEEQMMKEAVEGEITKDNRGNNVVRAGVFNKDFEYGDKVRIIIVKED